MEVSAFELLQRPIQRALWDMQWRELRPIQIDAIRKIIGSTDDLIISARTASGKTEAAFLPILSEIYREPAESVQAIYVGPLKALINDQFRRLEDLCERSEIPVHRWHGDVSAAKKQKFLANPGGVLLITPESIESMFINRSSALNHVLSDLRFVVIDEIHALVGNERGTHLRSLLFRVSQYCKRPLVRLIGLSATLGDAFSVYSSWLRPMEGNQVSLISDESEQKGLKFKIYGYETLAAKTGAKSEATDDEPDTLPPVVRDCFHHLVGAKNLVFANSRQQVEWFGDGLNECCRRERIPEQFLVHHGSLSKEIREFAESEMRGRRPLTIVCSSTLELGIDIGNVSTVGQLGPTWSVGSQVQRLGRSGRAEGEYQKMRVYVLEDPIDGKTFLVEQLRCRLLQAIATTELMLETPQWVEPPHIDRADFSTLTQQILSTLAETGGITAAKLFDRLVARGAFGTIAKLQYADLLRSLANHDLIEQMPEGDIILAPEGEQVVGHYSFYSAFASPIEFTVIHGSQKIGTLPATYLPNILDHFLLAGRRWQVQEIDDQRKEILVIPAKGKKPPMFLGSAGDIHNRIREKMREALIGQTGYPYLDEGATKLLDQARKVAMRTRLDENDWISLGPNECLWFTWTGTKAQRTLCLICDRMRLNAIDRGIAIQFSTNLDEANETLRRAAGQSHDPLILARLSNAKQRKKFDEFVADELLTQAIAVDALDITVAEQKLAQI